MVECCLHANKKHRYLWNRVHVWSCMKIFPHGEINRLKHLVIFGRIFLQHTVFIRRLAVPRARWQLDVQNCWALLHRQAFLLVSRKQNPVHVHTKILSRPGCMATSKFLSSISLRVKLTSMMAGDKNCNFTLFKTSQIGTFHNGRTWCKLFSKQKTKTNR